MHPRDHAERWPAKPAVIAHPSGASSTYLQLEQRSSKIAHWLDSSGVGEEATVAVVAENRPEWAEVLWGVLRSGRWIAPVNWHLTPAELHDVLRIARASVVVTTARHLDVVRAATDIEIAHVLVMQARDVDAGLTDYEAAIAAQPASRYPSRRIGGRVMFSAGTTGIPKAVRHAGPSGALEDAPPHLGQYTDLFAMDARTVYLSPAPTYHTAPFRFLHAVTQLGGTVVTLDRFDPEEALAAIERYGVTHAQFVPTMLVRMLGLPREVRNRHDLSSLQVAITGAAPCPPELKERIAEWWGPVLHELYGASESYGNCHIGPDEGLARRGSVGRALRGTIHITDDEGRDLPVGQVGRVWFEGTAPFRYEGDGEDHPTHPRGWSTVGDLGRLDADGYLYLAGRLDHVIVTGGVNVSAQEVENVIAVQPDVLDVAVIGLPHDDLGQQVTAYVVPRPDAHKERLAHLVIDHCRSRLAHFKCPRAVHLVNELPRADNGKLYKRRLEPFVG